MKQLTDEQAEELVIFLQRVSLIARVQVQPSTLDALTTPAPCPVPEGYTVAECKTWRDLQDGDRLCGLEWRRVCCDFGFAIFGCTYENLHKFADALIAAGNPVYRPIPKPEPDTAAKIADDLEVWIDAEPPVPYTIRDIVARLRKLGEGQS